MRPGRVLVPAAALLLAAACTPDAGTGQGEDPPSSISVEVSAGEPSEVDETVLEVEAGPAPEEPDATEDASEEPPAPI